MSGESDVVNGLRRHPRPCPKCGFEEHENYAAYCERCGEDVQLVNLCSNPNCVRNGVGGGDDPLECGEQARYCPDCGSPTSFSLDGRFPDLNSSVVQ